MWITGIPTIRFSLQGGDRTPDFKSMVMGTIKSVQYPEGAKVQFVFSQKDNPETNDPFYGINIDRITYYDKDGAQIRSKSYEYSEATLGHYLPQILLPFHTQ